MKLSRYGSLQRCVVTRHGESWDDSPVTPLIVLEAARGVRDHRLGYWDAQLWATARLNQIPTVLSEDFADGQTLDAVRFHDPFLPRFDLAALR